MLLTSKKVGSVCATLFALALILARPSIARAGDPLDNTIPWSTSLGVANYTDVTAYITTSSSTAWGPTSNGDRRISPTGDVDYFLIACGKLAGGTGIIKQVELNFTHSLGDLDMTVYTVDGKVVASSAGTSNSEIVNVAAQNKNAFFVKVYGYQGAVNPYTVILQCQ